MSKAVRPAKDIKTLHRIAVVCYMHIAYHGYLNTTINFEVTVLSQYGKENNTSRNISVIVFGFIYLLFCFIFGMHKFFGQ